MDDPCEHALVIKAFASALGARGYVVGYVEWIDDKAIAVARSKLADLDGLTPEEVRAMSIELVNAGLEVVQSRETRDNWSEFRFKYFITIPLDGVPWRVFVEFRLNDSDPQDPTVHIVSAHRHGV
jgi:hypothetical protein